MIEVLVVDDDFMVARVHAAYIERTPGFAVSGVAHTGTEALEAVAHLHPDLVLLDIYLPDISGLKVLRRLHDDAPDVDVLVVTAATEVDTVRAALHGGVVNYLLKPFPYDALRQRLEQYVGTHRPLAGAATVAQPDLDRVFGTSRRLPAALPKGLSAETADLVQGALREAPGDLSAAECAAATGLSRISARRYLEHFVDIGSTEVQLRYGGAGRPERRYRWRA